MGQAVGKLNTQARATQTIATTAGKQADAAGKSADATMQLLAVEKSLDRASMSIQEPTITNEVGRGDQLTLTILNSGREVATNVEYSQLQTVEAMSHLVNRERVAQIVKDNLSAITKSAPDTWGGVPDIPGGEKTEIHLVIRSSPARTSMEEVDYGRIAVGQVRYITTFGESRWKDFCIEMIPDLDSNHRLKWNLSFCPLGQEGDNIGTIQAEDKKQQR